MFAADIIALKSAKWTNVYIRKNALTTTLL